MNELSLLEFEATQHDVYRKMGQMYLSVVEQYFLVNVTHNLSIALIINTPSKSFSIGFTHFKYFFSSKFKHRLMLGLLFLYPQIVCFEIIVPQYYNYVSPIIWLPLFPVE